MHQIRNSLRYVASKNHKAFMVDLKRVYRAASLGEAVWAVPVAIARRWGPGPLSKDGASGKVEVVQSDRSLDLRHIRITAVSAIVDFPTLGSVKCI